MQITLLEKGVLVSLPLRRANASLSMNYSSLRTPLALCVLGFTICYLMAPQRVAAPLPQTQTITDRLPRLSPPVVWQEKILSEALANPDLVAAVQSLLTQFSDASALNIRLECLVESLPDSRLAEFSALLEAFPRVGHLRQSLLRHWAARDAAAALAWLEAYPDQREFLFPPYLEGWTKTDPDAALAWLQQQPPGIFLQSYRHAVLQTLAESQPERAWEIIDRNGWTATEPALLVKVLQTLGAKDATVALQVFRSITSRLGLDVEREQEKYNGSGTIAHLMEVLLHSVGRQSSAAASDLYSQLTDREKFLCQKNYLQEIVAHDPLLLMDWLSRPLDDRTRAQMVDVMPLLLVENFAALPDHDFRARLIQEIESSEFVKLAPSLKETLRGYIDQQPPAERTSLIKHMLVRPTEKNPDDALNYWKMLDDNGRASTGAQTLMKYAQARPEKALAVLKDCSESVQAASLRGLCFGLADNQPQAAFELALQQTDPELQSICLAEVLAHWFHDRKDEAIKALEEAAPQMNLQAVLAHLPKAGKFENTSYSLTIGPLSARLGELAAAPLPPASTP